MDGRSNYQQIPQYQPPNLDYGNAQNDNFVLPALNRAGSSSN